jgi:3-isopropylmalate/(R)-2-methylmalate dehydratase small subunit
MNERLTLRARRIGGVVSTDDILPARYKHMFTDPNDLAPHVFENVAPGLAATLEEGDALIGDDTFGIGSSREQAVSALLASGIRAVLAPAFGRIFFRNSWNLGLLALEVEGLDVEDGKPVEIELATGTVVAGGRRHGFTPVPPELIEMVASGGLLAQVRRMHARRDELAGV